MMVQAIENLPGKKSLTEHIVKNIINVREHLKL